MTFCSQRASNVGPVPTIRDKMMRNVEYWHDVGQHNPIARKLEYGRAVAEMVAKGERPAIYLCGPPGIGKSHLIADAVDGWRKLQDSRLPPTVKGNLRMIASSPVIVNEANYLATLDAFYDAMQFRSFGPRAMVFEEADQIFRSSRQFNTFKLATDQSSRAKRFHPGFRKKFEDENGEKRVVKGVWLDAPLFFSTNQNLAELATGSGPYQADADALFSRNPPVVIPDDAEAIFEWTVYLALTTTLISNTLTGKRIDLVIAERAVNWFSQNYARLRTPGPRALQNIARDIIDFRGRVLETALEQHLAPRPVREWDAHPVIPFEQLRLAFAQRWSVVQKLDYQRDRVSATG